GSSMPNHWDPKDPKKCSLFPCPLLVWAEETLKRGIAVNGTREHPIAPSPSVPLCWNNLGLTYMKMAERVAKLNMPDEELRLYAAASDSLLHAVREDNFVHGRPDDTPGGYETAWINLGTSY